VIGFSACPATSAPCEATDGGTAAFAGFVVDAPAGEQAAVTVLEYVCLFRIVISMIVV